MKKLLLLLLFSTSFIVANGQWGIWSCLNLITFDPGDTLYPHAITIDTTVYHHNIWQIGAPHKTVFTSAYSLPNVIVTDALNPYPVNDTSVFYLKIPNHLSSLSVVGFYYQLNIDSGAIAKIEISEDNGLDWVNYIDSLPSCFSYNDDTPVNLSSSTTGWTYFGLYGNYECADIPSDTFLFRFTFISDSIPTTKDGWMIDNIFVQFWCDANVSQIQNNGFILIFPNPAYDNLNITSSTPITQLTITNLLGQSIYTLQPNTENAQVDVSGLPPGVYFVKVNLAYRQAGNMEEVRKFVKE